MPNILVPIFNNIEKTNYVIVGNLSETLFEKIKEKLEPIYNEQNQLIGYIKKEQNEI